MKLAATPGVLRPGLLAGVLLVFVASINCCRATPTTWVLSNGDRLTGELLGEPGTSLVVQDTVLGRVEFPRSALVPARPTPSETSVKPAQPKASKWKRQLEFGFTRQSGQSSQQSLSLRGQIDGNLAPDTYRATAHVSKSASEGVTVADRIDADFRWRHDLSARVFLQSLTSGFSDGLAGIPLSLEEEVGAGWHVLKDPSQTADFGFGLAGRRQKQSVDGASLGLLGTLFENYAHTWSDGLHFTQEGSLALSGETPLTATPSPLGSTPVPTGGGNYRARFEAGFQGKVTEHTTYNLRYDYDFDRSVLNPALRTNQELTTGLGYTW